MNSFSVAKVRNESTLQILSIHLIRSIAFVLHLSSSINWFLNRCDSFPNPFDDVSKKLGKTRSGSPKHYLGRLFRLCGEGKGFLLEKIIVSDIE
ncbi:hypothetical protein CEXT_241821 [Caerostris extrusa]|uniref:Uncharacterized protein n=1 Tax=Caerostris extrusa TaxID=172846 RepID=A0AAV4XYD0_CAEEX|nr:hypothetical protein CEXT_241821 [Caerostris extrusa]